MVLVMDESLVSIYVAKIDGLWHIVITLVYNLYY